MLEHLDFVLEDPAGRTEARVSFEGGLVHARVQSTLAGDYQQQITLPPHLSKRWLSMLEDLELQGWKKRYRLPGGGVAGGGMGVSWQVTLHQADKKPHTSRGKDAYPLGWQAFLSLMDALAPVYPKDRVEALMLTYRRRLPGPSGRRSRGEEQHYLERLVLDRSSQSLSYQRRLGDGWHVTQTQEHHDLISRVLDQMRFGLGKIPQGEGSSAGHKGNQDLPSYELIVRYSGQESLFHSGLYHRPGLPEGWDLLMDSVDGILNLFGWRREATRPSHYGRGKKEGELIYLSVVFEPYGKEYYYQTQDSAIGPGDTVDVPVGSAGRIKRAMVVAVEYYLPEQAPYPPGETRLALGLSKQPLPDPEMEWESFEGD